MHCWGEAILALSAKGWIQVDKEDGILGSRNTGSEGWASEVRIRISPPAPSPFSTARIERGSRLEQAG
jgi:hypothetical protein